MIKLGRLRIDNFKSISSFMEFNLSNNDLILLNGPNGFGKTTIFDAIELCFTGKISRIFGTDTKVKDSHLLKNDNNKKTSIHLELINKTGTEVVICITIDAGLKGQLGKIDNYQSTINRILYNEWPSFSNNEVDYSNAIIINNNNLSNIVGNHKLEETFNLFNYIQQEDTCHYLKAKESKRYKDINYLFGTVEETNELNKIEDIRNGIDEHIKSTVTAIGIEYKKLTELLKTSTKDNIQLTSSKTINKFDQLKNCTIEQLQSYKNDLFKIIWLLNNKTEFKKIRWNNTLSLIVNNHTNEIKDMLRTGMCNSINELTKIDTHYNNWIKYNNKINNQKKIIEQFNLSNKSFDYNIISYIKKNHFNIYNKFSNEVLLYDTLSKSCNTLEDLILKIKEDRNNLLINYKLHSSNYKHNDKNITLINCPFCGNEKTNWKELKKQYLKQEDNFNIHLSELSIQIETVKTNLLNNLISPFIKKIKKINEKYKLYVDFDFESIKKEKLITNERFDKMKRLKLWLSINIPETMNLIDNNLYSINNDYLSAYSITITNINSKYKQINTANEYEFSEIKESINNLALDIKMITNLDITNINNDFDYITSLIVQKQSDRYTKIEIEHNKLIRKHTKLQEKKDYINNIIKVYTDEIKKYEKNIAKQIAIPLFVYSSKILQSRPEGSGVFLSTPDKNKATGFIKFCSTSSDSHDAWNTMSSGQLSGIVISFMLAMNKAYPSNLSTLMIDDPVQTMDDVNMASFVQMLLNEFPEKQILLSTHESKVANYFIFKYLQSDLNPQPINMKEERFKMTHILN